MRIAFAGFRHGHIYGIFKEAVRNENVVITGCFEEDVQARKEAQVKWGDLFVYETYEDILQDPSVEVVAIGDYFAKRGRMVIEALKHGKHVISDKPFCTELDEVDEIESLAEKNNLQVMSMFDLRYIPQAEKAKEIIQSGVLGDIHIVSFTGQHFLNYGSRPGWYYEKGKHGGTINDLGIHGVDMVRYLTGKNLTKINCAKTWNAFADQEPEFNDCGQFMAEMDGMSVMADVSYSAPQCAGILPTSWNFCFWGSKGMLNFSYNDKKLHVYTDSEKVVECTKVPHFYLEDLEKEIAGEKTRMSEGNIFESQRQTLQIQKAAEIGGKF